MERRRVRSQRASTHTGPDSREEAGEVGHVVPVVEREKREEGGRGEVMDVRAEGEGREG